MKCLDYDVLVIGGGPAGLAAALEAKNSGAHSVAILERDNQLGGILQQCIHPGFGLHLFRKELTGPEYAEKFIAEIHSMNIDVLLDTTVLELEENGLVYAINSSHGVFALKARSKVLATGCRERTRGAIKTPGTRPAGIYTAGTAQRFVNIEGYMPGTQVVILGSGDVGLIMARRLTLEGAKVKAVLELMPYPGGLTRNINQCLSDFGIPLLLSHTVVRIHGKRRLQGITYAKVDEVGKPIEGTEKFIECDTLLLSVGLIPENEIVRKTEILMDPMTGGPMVNSLMETSLPGVFACGNTLHVNDLVDNVTFESKIAGKAAAQYAMNLEKWACGISLPVTAQEGIRYVVPQKIVLSPRTHPGLEDSKILADVLAPLDASRSNSGLKDSKAPAEPILRDPLGRTMISLFMRAKEPLANATLEIILASAGRTSHSAPEAKVLYRNTFAAARPGEMLKAPLDLKKLSSEIKRLSSRKNQRLQDFLIQVRLVGEKATVSKGAASILQAAIPKSHEPIMSQEEANKPQTPLDKIVICTVCPKGCQITVRNDHGLGRRKEYGGRHDSRESFDNLVIVGAGCPRGQDYAKEETTNPKRILTTTVSVKGGRLPLVPVRTDRPISKSLLDECMKILTGIEIQAPCKLNQVVLEDIFGTGVNIVATRSVSKSD